ncbi:hypothetical protein CPB83DRAFT_894422 [Crepidotus variabilis]|uniref:Uncharacterized protein n=1 Tax=Crepidotus variabilis TaxID=179855 RepID=A0A9P6EF47_9AGAR|nr:hypothetical protein CPB83DRAFT_894422 [Crepidotus variabilis]
MTFLTSCFNQLADSPSFLRLRRSKEKDLDQHPVSPTPAPKHSSSPTKASTISPVFGRPRSPFSPAGMSSYDHCDDSDESEPLLVSQPSSPSPVPSGAFSSLLSASSLPRPQEMMIVKSASSDDRLGLGLLDEPTIPSAPTTIPLLPTIQVRSKFIEPAIRTVNPFDYSSSGHKLDFSPNAFQLDKYVVNINRPLPLIGGSLPIPPPMENRVTSDAPTAYYTMEDTKSSAPATVKSFASLNQSPDRKTIDEHEAYLASLKLLRFGESSSQASYSVLSFTFDVIAETVDDDTTSWENVSLSSYGWV